MSTLNKGQILEDTYEIIEEIGAGGGGIVFRARHLRLQTDVVIKKIKDEIRSKVNLRQEADLLKNLKHPYLPRVYDFLEREDGVYTVMDFIQGEDLDTAINRQGKYSQKEVKKWAEQLGEVLAYLHGQNPPIIHSDIKPANIMLTQNGDICLIDFNISLAAGLDSKTAVGISVGFSPPEQYRDPALYERMTHNFTRQHLSKVKQDNSVGTAKSPERQQITLDRTELLGGGQDSWGKTEHLGGEQDASDRTELLIEGTGEGDSLDKTELLWEEKEVLLSQTPSGEEATLLLTERTESGEGSKQQKNNEVSRARRAGSSPYTLYMGRGVDARSDIYSLGITLYYLVTGILPPVDFEQRIPIQQTGVTVSEGFALILEKMMEPNPSDRYQNGAEFLKAISQSHKLDKRYILMYRKQNALYLAALCCLALGILLIFSGADKLRAERNASYYSLVQQAEMLIEENKLKEAALKLKEARELSDKRIDAYQKEVYLLYSGGQMEECIRLGENYINTLPFSLEEQEDKEQFGNICFLVGNAYFESGDYGNAKAMLEQAIQHHGENGSFYRDYAITLAKLGQLEEAKIQLEKGIEKGIKQDSISMVQGELAHVRGENEKALEHLKHAISLTADMQMKKRAILLAVDVCKAIGTKALDEEIALLENYGTEFEERGSLVLTEYLADAYVRKAGEDKEQANTYYEKALELFERIADHGYMTWQLKENMGILYQNMDRFDEAGEIFGEMAEENPDSYEVYKRLAYLEADRQQMLENSKRSYLKMKEYYELARERYDESIQDVEMEMLENMMQQLKAGGWF